MDKVTTVIDSLTSEELKYAKSLLEFKKKISSLQDDFDQMSIFLTEEEKKSFTDHIATIAIDFLPENPFGVNEFLDIIGRKDITATPGAGSWGHKQDRSTPTKNTSKSRVDADEYISHNIIGDNSWLDGKRNVLTVLENAFESLGNVVEKYKKIAEDRVAKSAQAMEEVGPDLAFVHGGEDWKENPFNPVPWNEYVQNIDINDFKKILAKWRNNMVVNEDEKVTASKQRVLENRLSKSFVEAEKEVGRPLTPEEKLSLIAEVSSEDSQSIGYIDETYLKKYQKSIESSYGRKLTKEEYKDLQQKLLIAPFTREKGLKTRADFGIDTPETEISRLYENYVTQHKFIVHSWEEVLRDVKNEKERRLFAAKEQGAQNFPGVAELNQAFPFDNHATGDEFSNAPRFQVIWGNSNNFPSATDEQLELTEVSITEELLWLNENFITPDQLGSPKGIEKLKSVMQKTPDLKEKDRYPVVSPELQVSQAPQALEIPSVGETVGTPASPGIPPQNPEEEITDLSDEDISILLDEDQQSPQQKKSSLKRAADDPTPPETEEDFGDITLEDSPQEMVAGEASAQEPAPVNVGQYPILEKARQDLIRILGQKFMNAYNNSDALPGIIGNIEKYYQSIGNAFKNVVDAFSTLSSSAMITDLAEKSESLGRNFKDYVEDLKAIVAPEVSNIQKIFNAWGYDEKTIKVIDDIKSDAFAIMEYLKTNDMVDPNTPSFRMYYDRLEMLATKALLKKPEELSEKDQKTFATVMKDSPIVKSVAPHLRGTIDNLLLNLKQEYPRLQGGPKYVSDNFENALNKIFKADPKDQPVKLREFLSTSPEMQYLMKNKPEFSSIIGEKLKPLAETNLDKKQLRKEFRPLLSSLSEFKKEMKKVLDYIETISAGDSPTSGILDEFAMVVSNSLGMDSPNLDQDLRDSVQYLGKDAVNYLADTGIDFNQFKNYFKQIPVQSYDSLMKGVADAEGNVSSISDIFKDNQEFQAWSEKLSGMGVQPEKVFKEMIRRVSVEGKGLNYSNTIASEKLYSIKEQIPKLSAKITGRVEELGEGYETDSSILADTKKLKELVREQQSILRTQAQVDEPGFANVMRKMYPHVFDFYKPDAVPKEIDKYVKNYRLAPMGDESLTDKLKKNLSNLTTTMSQMKSIASKAFVMKKDTGLEHNAPSEGLMDSAPALQVMKEKLIKTRPDPTKQKETEQLNKDYRLLYEVNESLGKGKPISQEDLTRAKELINQYKPYATRERPLTPGDVKDLQSLNEKERGLREPV